MSSIRDRKLSYRIDVTWDDLVKTQSKVYEADVVEVVRACDGTVADYVTNASVPVSSASGDLSLPDGFDGVYAVEPEAPEREQGPTTPAISGPGQGAGQEDDSEGGSNAAWYIIGGVAAVVPFVFNPTTGSTTGSATGCDLPRPPLPSSCVGISRNSSSCNNIVGRWEAYCVCNKFRGFNVLYRFVLLSHRLTGCPSRFRWRGRWVRPWSHSPSPSRASQQH